MSRPEDTAGHEQDALDAYGGTRGEAGADNPADSDGRHAPLSARYGRANRAPVNHGDEPAAEPERPRDRCQNCNAEVRGRERRLFGDNANVLWHCRRCLDERSALRVGAGARPDWDPDGFASKQDFRALGGDR